MLKRKRLIAIFVGLMLIFVASWHALELRNQNELARLKSAQASRKKAPHLEPESQFVIVRNGKLNLEGKPYRFLGVNIYSLLSYPYGQGRYGCGRAYTESGVRALMKEVSDMGANVIRTQAFQSHLRNPKDKKTLDFSRFDTVIALAKAKNIRLIVTLENQWWDCSEGGYKWGNWYSHKYRAPYGRYQLAYRDFVRRVVTHYKDEPTILMWQLMNEAESRDASSLLEDPDSLSRFVSDMTRVVKNADSNHLLSSGVSDIKAPGAGGPFYTLLNQIAGIDIIEAHDYDHDTEAKPGSIRTSMAVARHLKKPFFIGEVGVAINSSTSRGRRARLVMQKVVSAWKNGADGILIWSYRAGDGRGYDFGNRDR